MIFSVGWICPGILLEVISQNLILFGHVWCTARWISGSKTKKEEKWEHACLCPSFGFDFIVLFVWHSKIVCLCLHFLRTKRHYYILNYKLSVAYLAKNMTWRFSIPIELIQEAPGSRVPVSFSPLSLSQLRSVAWDILTTL